MTGEGSAPDVSRWVIIYPVYINSKKTLAEGRRISITHACENPTIQEIADCCNHLKLASVAEPDKAYSRDFMQRGRVRVHLKQDRVPVNSDIPSRKVLMHRIAELVPAHPGRRRRDQTAASGGAASVPSSSGKGGKSGRKKK